MPQMIFVNLPIADLDRSIGFYEAIGATKNPQFSDSTAACMVMSETIHVMLLTHDKFRQFAHKPIADTQTSCAVLFCVSAESRNAVDAAIAAAGRGGGRADPTPAHDHGFMYGRSFEDPDGHGWQVMWMDMAAHQQAMCGDKAVAA